MDNGLINWGGGGSATTSSGSSAGTIDWSVPPEQKALQRTVPIAKTAEQIHLPQNIQQHSGQNFFSKFKSTVGNAFSGGQPSNVKPQSIPKSQPLLPKQAPQVLQGVQKQVQQTPVSNTPNTGFKQILGALGGIAQGTARAIDRK